MGNLSSLSALPEENPDIFRCILMDFISLIDVAKLDSAILNKAYRPLFLSYLANENLCFKYNYRVTESFLGWLAKRLIIVESLRVEEESNISSSLMLSNVRVCKLKDFHCVTRAQEYPNLRAAVTEILRRSNLKKFRMNMPIMVSVDELMTYSMNFTTLISLSLCFKMQLPFIYLVDTNLIQALRYASNLQNLSLSHIEIYSAENASKLCLSCPRIKELSFSNCHVSDVATVILLSRFNNLRVLCMSHCQVNSIDIADNEDAKFQFDSTFTLATSPPSINRRVLLPYIDTGPLLSEIIARSSSVRAIECDTITSTAASELLNLTLIYSGEFIMCYVQKILEKRNFFTLFL